jgi:hypothetical protein
VSGPEKTCTFLANHLSYFSVASFTGTAGTSGSNGIAGGGSSSLVFGPSGGAFGAGTSSWGSSTTTTGNGSNTNTNTATGLLFTDISGSWAESAIRTLASRGIINNATRFRPSDSLTRAEFLKIVGNSAGWKLAEINGKRIPFRDVASSDWFAPYAVYAATNGVISNGTRFRPNAQISRAEIAKILVNALGYPISLEASAFFSDVDGTTSLSPYIQTAKHYGIFDGQQNADGTWIFRPNDPITRAEIAKTVMDAFGIQTSSNP